MNLWYITAVSTKGVAAIYQIGKYQRLRNISSSLIAHSSCGARVLICQGRLTDASELTRNYVRGAAHYKFTLTRWHVENCGHIVIFIPSIACFMRTAASLFNIPFSQRVSVNRKKKEKEKKKSKIRILLLHDIIYFDINFEIEAVRFSRLASRTVGITRKGEITNGRQKKLSSKKEKERKRSSYPSKTVAYVPLAQTIGLHATESVRLDYETFVLPARSGRSWRLLSVRRQWSSLRTLCPRTRAQGEA